MPGAWGGSSGLDTDCQNGASAGVAPTREVTTMRLVNQAAGVRRTAVAILVAIPVRIIAPADATSSYRVCDDDVILDIDIRSGTVRIRF